MVSPPSNSLNEFFLITVLLYIFGGKKINYMMVFIVNSTHLIT